MTKQSTERLWRRQLLVMAAVLLGATLLLVGLLPPQQARGQEQPQQQQNPTPPHVARGMQQQEQQNAAPPNQGDEQAQGQEEERVFDKDPQGHEYVAGELLVSYEKGASKQAKEEMPKKVGAKVEKDFPKLEVQHLLVHEIKNERAQEARQQASNARRRTWSNTPA